MGRAWRLGAVIARMRLNMTGCSLCCALRIQNTKTVSHGVEASSDARPRVMTPPINPKPFGNVNAGCRRGRPTVKNITLNIQRVTQQAWGGAADVPRKSRCIFQNLKAPHQLHDIPCKSESQMEEYVGYWKGYEVIV